MKRLLRPKMELQSKNTTLFYGNIIIDVLSLTETLALINYYSLIHLLRQVWKMSQQHPWEAETATHLYHSYFCWSNSWSTESKFILKQQLLKTMTMNGAIIVNCILSMWFKHNYVFEFSETDRPTRDFSTTQIQHCWAFLIGNIHFSDFNREWWTNYCFLIDFKLIFT